MVWGEKGRFVKIERAFGSVLKDAREKAGLSQDQLAHDAGLHRTYISLLERNRRQPSLRAIVALSKALDLAPSTLVSRFEDKVDEG